jgi:hypothetical protein
MGKDGFVPSQLSVARLDVRDGEPALFEPSADTWVKRPLAVDQPHGVAETEREVKQVVAQGSHLVPDDLEVVEFQGAEDQRAVPRHAGLKLVTGYADVLHGPGHRLPTSTSPFNRPFTRLALARQSVIYV